MCQFNGDFSLFFSNGCCPVCKGPPFCGMHGAHTGIGWGQYQLLQLSCVFLRLDRDSICMWGTSECPLFLPSLTCAKCPHTLGQNAGIPESVCVLPVCRPRAGCGHWMALGRQGVPTPLGSEPPLPTAPCTHSLQQQRDTVLVTHRVNLCTHINP